ncbi:MAG TPA: type I methionyl aminopeptidase, partial [Terriglobales bacterium]|nr:type I methionyl aminopeptidase [Terriglobales bacterium]
LQVMARAVRPGVTTAELDRIAARELARYGAESSPALVYGFPGASCISLNSQVVHGVPDSRTTVQPGDLVKLDLTAQKDGYVADAAVTVAVPPASLTARRLAQCAQSAFESARSVARAGSRVSAIGRAVEKEVRAAGFEVLRQWCGHGVGRTIHERPEVPNFEDRRCSAALTEGLVITIEPIITAGIDKSFVSSDGWTVVTADQALSAHYEHTVVITRGKPMVLTSLQ